MTFSQRAAVISLLHKKGEETSLQNYRPITSSLTNTEKLQKVVGNIINEHYSAYINGRYIEENARIILDILH